MAKTLSHAWLLAGCLLCVVTSGNVRADDVLQRNFAHPPDAVKPWTYWWWLNGCVTKDGIVRDLDGMQRQGVSGALVFQAGKGETPFRTEFMSPAWRELFRFAVAEAAQRNIVIGLNVCDGWNAGGPWVKAEEAAQSLVLKARRVVGPSPPVAIGEPAHRDAYYRDIAVLAWQVQGTEASGRAVCQSRSYLDLTGHLKPDGRIDWQAPAGVWAVVRFGHTVPLRAHTKCTGGPSCYEIDPLRADAMDRHFAATVAVVLDDVKAYAGKTFQYVHIDSGEIGEPNWTPAFREEFRRRRGYDPFPYLAAKARMAVDSAEITERFLEDYDRTLGDLMVENYYGRLAELARRHGLGAHSEAAGFQKPCVDALRSLGVNDICMSEFWARREESANPYIHQLTDRLLRNHDGIKTAAAAAHAYGRPIVQAEAYTVMRRLNWDKDPYALKDIGDRAFCAGLNRVMLCFMVHQPEEQSKPGYEWPGVGTEFDRHVTWWPLSHAWLAYLARCQSLLQAGTFVADACYFQGEWVPSYLPARWAMNPPLPPGYDCDAVSAEILTTRAGVERDGRLQLPGGTAYRYLVLNQAGRWSSGPLFTESKQKPAPTPVVPAAPSQPQPLAISAATLSQIKDLVERGMTLAGPPPARAIGLAGYPQCDREIARLADLIWGPERASAGERKLGKGRVIWGHPLADVFRTDRLSPDLVIREDDASKTLPAATLNGIPNPGSFDWIHRRIGPLDAYFLANLRSVRTGGDFLFRVANEQPELWDPVTGSTRLLPQFAATDDGRTRVPLQFQPRESYFVVFRQPIAPGKVVHPASNFPPLRPLAEIAGPWEVSFDPTWGGPQKVTFQKLVDWTERPETGIKYYSGRATYRTTFDLPAAAVRGAESPLHLSLGTVKNVAEVRVNGQTAGVVWTAPWQVPITGLVHAGANALEIDVVNLWPNRLIGDAALPLEKRLTKTNVTSASAETPLLPSGLLGPVTVQAGL